MLKKERENEIVNMLSECGGYATVKSLCEKIYSSESSIRRALSSLESKGVINRVYGGAELTGDFSHIIDFKKRAYHNSEAKIAIAKKASKLVNDNDVIFLDQSSSAFYLAREIVNIPKITIVTNNIEIISLLSSYKINVISSGGTLSRENRTCLIGSNACAAFENIYADTVFFSVKSLSENGNLYDCTLDETAVRNEMLRNARKKVFLCDSTKVGTSSPYKQCNISDIDIIISEKELYMPILAEHKNLKLI